MTNSCLEQARAFWLTNRLRYLVPLKYTHLYPDVVTCDCDVDGGSFGALLHYATRDIFWDVGMYPHSDRIIIPTANDEAAARRLCDRVQQSDVKNPVFKFSESATRDIFLAAFPAQYARTLISYTAPSVIKPGVANPLWTADSEVECSDVPGDAVQAMYRANGYSDDELAHYFGSGALAFTLFDEGAPVCTCMTYQNFDDVWEIGGLHTLPAGRRKGYARRVVQSALALLAERQFIPRYLVDSTNTASVSLAESLGLHIGLRFEHYTTISHSDIE